VTTNALETRRQETGPDPSTVTTLYGTVAPTLTWG
jgi:hypothetical protein